MHLSRFLPVLLPFGLVYVLSQPLKVAYVKAGLDDNHPDVPVRPADAKPDLNRQAIDHAVVLANRMLSKMMLVIKDPQVPKHQELISAAFGPHADVGKIKKNIETINKATVRARVAIDSLLGNEAASTRFVDKLPQAGGKAHAKVADDGDVADSVTFGSRFFDRLCDMQRAAVLIHEAAVYVNRATDDILATPRADGKQPERMEMHPYGKEVPAGRMVKQTVYHKRKFPKTATEALSHPPWKDLTEKAHNMDESAHAYTVFAFLCYHGEAGGPEMKREFTLCQWPRRIL